MDIFSKMIIQWEIHEHENADLASGMIEEACRINRVGKKQVVLHSDNGGPMKSATMLAKLQRLGVAPSFSRPKVSNDNPFLESLFKTMKYCPSFPGIGFFILEEARGWGKKFVNWYNNVHLHSGINFVTPASKHRGTDEEILKKRHSIYQLAKAKNPNRWSQKTRNWSRIEKVELNPRKKEEKLAA